MLRRIILALVAAVAVGGMTLAPTVASARGGRGGGGGGRGGGGFRAAGRGGGGFRGFRGGGFRGGGFRRGFRVWAGPAYSSCYRWRPTPWGWRWVNVCYDWY